MSQEPQIHQRELVPSDLITAFFYSPPYMPTNEKPLLFVNCELVDNREAYFAAAQCAQMGYYDLAGGNYIKHHCVPITWGEVVAFHTSKDESNTQL